MVTYYGYILHTYIYIYIFSTTATKLLRMRECAIIRYYAYISIFIIVRTLFCQSVRVGISNGTHDRQSQMGTVLVRNIYIYNYILLRRSWIKVPCMSQIRRFTRYHIYEPRLNNFEPDALTFLLFLCFLPTTCVSGDINGS
jgi:hypothetical protein